MEYSYIANVQPDYKVVFLTKVCIVVRNEKIDSSFPLHPSWMSLLFDVKQNQLKNEATSHSGTIEATKTHEIRVSSRSINGHLFAL